MLYGLPYMGSKSDIAKQIVDILPAADTLVDLFAGGCAITHA
ncbi:MAG: DNA adenine methylase, partial [Victivallales bacterium]|nr:DNA adenine methylase [Victivallales bacterium]